MQVGCQRGWIAFMTSEAGHDHNHSHGHGHGHGNENDRGARAMLRYARSAKRMWQSAVNDAVVALIDPKPGEVVVDVGAGVGAGSVVAAKAAAKVVAVEPTPYMRRILRLRRRFVRAAPGITVVDGAAEATGLEAESADAVFAVNTMHHWVDLDAGVRELYRILAPGGRAVLADEDFDDPTHPDYERFKDRHGDDGDSHGFEMVDVQGIAETLDAAGLHVQQAEVVDLADRPVILIRAIKPL